MDTSFGITEDFLVTITISSGLHVKTSYTGFLDVHFPEKLF